MKLTNQQTLIDNQFQDPDIQEFDLDMWINAGDSFINSDSTWISYVQFSGNGVRSVHHSHLISLIGDRGYVLITGDMR